MDKAAWLCRIYVLFNKGIALACGAGNRRSFVRVTAQDAECESINRFAAWICLYAAAVVTGEHVKKAEHAAKPVARPKEALCMPQYLAVGCF